MGIKLFKGICNEPIDFLLYFLERRTTSMFFNRIDNTLLQKNVTNEPLSSNKIFQGQLHTVFDVPGYLLGQPSKNEGIICRKVNMYQGYLINLTNYSNLNEYLKSNFTSKIRTQLRAYKKRLEICFPISYRTYYGSMEKDHYDHIFQEFKLMLEKRSIEKGIINDELEHWNVYEEIAYELILDKKACLSVIYNGTEPISICFNLIHGKVIYGCIKSHDNDYSKFSVGFVDLLKQLEWCFEQNFEIFDFLKGDYEYKSKWIDSDYYFQKYIIYDSNSPLVNLVALLTLTRYKLLYSLARTIKKSRGYNMIQQHKANKRRRKNSKRTAYLVKECEISEIPRKPQSLINPICLNETKFSFLKKNLNDFLFSNKCSIGAVNVFKDVNKTNVFYICNDTSAIKITAIL